MTSPLVETVAFGRLHDHTSMERMLPAERDWRFDAFQKLDELLSDPAFPCLFGRRAWRDKSALLLFCSHVECGGTEHFRTGVQRYTEWVKATSVKERLFAPLIVFVNERLGSRRESHHNNAWKLLQGLLDADATPWPKNVPKDPNDPRWSFCFNGMQLFFNISTPAHETLRSRRLGNYLNFIVNPRENFDVVASSQDKGGKLVRQKIRDRVSEYNAGFVPPELGFFGDRDNFEWKQFQLGEPDLPGPTSCPLKFRRRVETQ